MKNSFHKYVSMRTAVCNKCPLLDCLPGPLFDDSFLSLLLNPTYSVFPHVMPPIRSHMKSARNLEWIRFTSHKISIYLHLYPKLRNKEAKSRRKYFAEELLHLNQYKDLKFNKPCVTCFNRFHLGFLLQIFQIKTKISVDTLRTYFWPRGAKSA